jgi:uncharacterized protein YecE (DUF72 family)
MKPLHVGCSGWNYDDWRGVIYERGLAKKRWLARYAELFDTVEVNSSFYRLPERKTVAEWERQTRDGFCFAFKVSRYLTHVKRLQGVGGGLRRLWGRLGPVREAGKLGPILWQLPPNLQAEPARLEHLLGVLPGGRHAFEFRHPSWFGPETYDLLEGAGAALVIADHPERDYGEARMTAEWTYVRLHYGSRGRRGNYSDRELRTWKRRISSWRGRREVFVYLNNDWEGFAPRNALELI